MKYKILKIIPVILILLGALLNSKLIFANSAGGFTCCPQKGSHCVYDGKYVSIDTYFQSDGPCLAE